MPTTKTQKKRKKYIFTLQNINTENIDQRYGIALMSNLEEEDHNPQITTKLDDLDENNKTPTVISFLDEAKYLRKCTVTMIDFKTNQSITDSKYHCWWCRHPIPNNVHPIGCPIRYVPHQAIKNYYSELSKDRYTIKENITTKRAKNILNKKDRRMSLVRRGYYITEGSYCSFNCCMAFIQDPCTKKNDFYCESQSLLFKMYNDMYEENIDEIIPAHSWKKLNCYGGDLTIENFRENFNRMEYINHGKNMKYPRQPTQISLGELYEEQLKL